MKKKSILSLALAGVLTMGLMGCGSKDAADDKTIKIGVKPSSEIFSASSIVYANFVEFTLSLTNLDKIFIHSIAVL
mgnify:CR=1 FL=1